MAIFRRRQSKPRHKVLNRFDPSDMAEADRLTLEALVERGADLANERNVRHYLYGDSLEALRTAASRLEDAGYAVQVGRAATGPQFLAMAEQRQLLNAETAAQARQLFESLASEIPGGDYDGWEAELVEA
jgi:regulator of RNase E activity RraB